SGSGNIHSAEYKRRDGSCLEIERLCRDAHAKGVLMFSPCLLVSTPVWGQNWGHNFSLFFGCPHNEALRPPGSGLKANGNPL
ncbi:hypothetical protein, partial [Providencia rettgeri]|uniref:hypothetical protein n=1 Tax=Providencia rettgeri TaxID=587 RepID=UPI003019BDA3